MTVQHCEQAIPVSGWHKYANEPRSIIDAYSLEALRHFDQATHAEITPDLVLLDALARSLKMVAP